MVQEGHWDYLLGTAVSSWKYEKAHEGERSFARDELAWAERRQRRKIKGPQQAKIMAYAKVNNNADADANAGNAKITIRQHPFSSPEARFLVGELDRSIAEFYPDWDQVNYPAMKHDNNLHLAHGKTAEQASLDFFGQVNAPMEDEETRGQLVFFIAFDTTGMRATNSPNQKGTPVACAGLRLLSTPDRQVPAELEPSRRYAELKRMFVLPEYQRRGISTLLLQHVEEHALKTLEVDFIVLETGLRQKASLRLYEGMGYKRRSMFGEYVGADPESGGDSTCLEKKLS